MLDMFKTLMASLFQKPATVAFPKRPMRYYPGARGHIAVGIESCVFCGLCARRCPTSAIAVDRAEKTWEIGRFSCIQCGCCVEVCPKKCLRMEPAQPPAASVMTKDLMRDARVPADSPDH